MTDTQTDPFAPPGKGGDKLPLDELTGALLLFTVKSVRPNLVWPEKLLKFAFWGINLGLGLMVLISVLPVGLLQTWAAVDVGYWYARSAEFLQAEPMQTLRWMRVVGDTIFALGSFAFVIAIVRMTLARYQRPDAPVAIVR